MLMLRSCQASDSSLMTNRVMMYASARWCCLGPAWTPEHGDRPCQKVQLTETYLIMNSFPG